MATLRDIRRRIKSIRSTQQITKAMEMVSAAKLRRAQGRLEAARPYGLKIREMLENLAAVAAEVQHPLFEKRPVERRVLVVVTGDRGLAGSYNGAVIRRAEAYMRGPEGARTLLVTVGRKGQDYFRRRQIPTLRQFTDLGDPVNLIRAQAMSREIVDLFLDRDTDEIVVLGTRFISAMSRALTLETFLPIEPPAGKRDPVDYIFEPDAAAIFSRLVPDYVANRMLMILLEALASEHGARMVAMGSASKNAGEVIDRLTLDHNRARQAAITKEIAEIVGGAEALK